LDLNSGAFRLRGLYGEFSKRHGVLQRRRGQTFLTRRVKRARKNLLTDSLFAASDVNGLLPSS